MVRIEQLYFNWLLDFVATAADKKAYSVLLKKLFNYNYYSLNSLDDNYYVFAREFRERFCEEKGQDYEKLYRKPICILEVLVYLADDIEWNRLGPDDELGNRTGHWFWGMIADFGLTDMDDLHYDDIQVDGILYNFVNKKYKKDGSGSPFVVKRFPNYDATKDSINGQMSKHLSNLLGLR